MDDATRTPDWVELTVRWTGLAPVERGQVYEQARVLAVKFERRERLNVSGILWNLAAGALFVTSNDRIGHAAPTEWTTPLDQFRDDVGILLLEVDRILDQEGLLTGVRGLWEQVREQLVRYRNHTFGTT